MRRGQAAVEYIMLIALGIFIIVIAFALAYWLKTSFSDTVLAGVDNTRREVISLFVHA